MHVCYVVPPSIIWDHHLLHFANLVFIIDVCIILSCKQSPISVWTATPLDCLIKCNAVGNLILLYDGHWDVQMLHMSYNLLHNWFVYAFLHKNTQSCVLIIAYYMTLSIDVYATIPSAVLRPTGHSIANTASGRSMLLWMDPSYQHLFLALIDWIWWQGATVTMLMGSLTLWWELHDFVCFCNLDLWISFSNYWVHASLHWGGYLIFLKASPMVCINFWWISQIPSAAHATQFQFTTPTRGKMHTIKKYSLSKSFPIQWYGGQN